MSFNRNIKKNKLINETTKISMKYKQIKKNQKLTKKL